jgi:hypothetical protein
VVDVGHLAALDKHLSAGFAVTTTNIMPLPITLGFGRGYDRVLGGNPYLLLDMFLFPGYDRVLGGSPYLLLDMFLFPTTYEASQTQNPESQKSQTLNPEP